MSSDPVAVRQWVMSGSNWQWEDKRAVLNFIFNFMRLGGWRELAQKKAKLDDLIENWKKELHRLHIELSV